VEIGRVSNISLSGGRALVRMDIFKTIKITKDAVALIRTKGVLGDRYVEIRQGNSAEIIPPGGEIARTRSPVDLETLLVEIGPMIRDFQAVAETLRTILEDKKLKGLVADLSEAATSFKMVAHNLANGKGTIGKLLADDSIYRQLEKVSQNLEAMSVDLKQLVADVKAGKGTLGRFLVDDSMYTKLEKLVATTQEAANNLNEIAAQLSSGKGTLGKFLADDELYKSLVSAAQRLDNLSRKLEKGEGTLGKLFQDDTLYKEIKRTVININRAAVGTQEVLPTTVLGTIGSAVLQ